MNLMSTVRVDDFTKKISKAFDFEFDGQIKTEIPTIPKIPDLFKIGIIVGSSGSGKSTLLKNFGEQQQICWDTDKAICSHFTEPDDAINRLTAMGLNSIPSMLKPFHVLSNGEKYRAILARTLKTGAVMDEFTSVVDRNVAKAMSVSISKFIEKNNIHSVVFASCHYDVIEWLQPDWVFYTDTNSMVQRGSLRQRPQIKLDIVRLTSDSRNKAWEIFKKHHYLSQDMNPASRAYGAFFNGELVGLSLNLSLPSRIPPLYEGDNRNKFRESRLVILPDFQGMGIGTRFSNAVGQIFLDEGYRYFSKTAHIRMGEYRQKSKLWRPTSTNLKDRAKSQKASKKDLWYHMVLDTVRICYSHEYVGPDYIKSREPIDTNESPIFWSML